MRKPHANRIGIHIWPASAALEISIRPTNSQLNRFTKTYIASNTWCRLVPQSATNERKAAEGLWKS